MSLCVGQNCAVTSPFSSPPEKNPWGGGRGLPAALSFKCTASWSLVIRPELNIPPAALPGLKILELPPHVPLAAICSYLFVWVEQLLVILTSMNRAAPSQKALFCILGEDTSEGTSLFLLPFTNKKGEIGTRSLRVKFWSCSFITLE